MLITLKPSEFVLFRQLMSKCTGINLAESKLPLVHSRLARRVAHHDLRSFAEYFRMITAVGGREELQTAIDLLTTNETAFFREAEHFGFLRDGVKRAPDGRPFRVWSAACSSGEEPYSIAMVLADKYGFDGWEVVGSDICTRVLRQAETGHFPLARAAGIPRDYLVRFCLKGVGNQDGTFMVAPELCRRVRFRQLNLNATLPPIGEFDVIFLRNVMIYFDLPTKRKVVQRMLSLIRPRGYLFVGHSESLNNVSSDMEAVMPAVYRRP